jgi:tetratricopeptide (TPR) repeat protein
MAVDKNKAKMEAEIADKFSESVAAFDADELVKAKKGFDTILVLNPEHTGAKVYLEKIQSRYTGLAQESFKMGMDFFAASEYPKAKLAFQKTLTIDENHIDAKAMLAKTEEVMVDSAKREAEMARLAGATQAYKDGLAAYQKNNLEGALKKFAEVQTLAPDFEEVTRYLNLTKVSLGNILFEESQVLFQNGQLEGAVARLNRAHELNPDDARIKSALDVALRDLEQKNAEESQKLYREGLEAYLGGNTEKAEKNWKRALELDSTNEDALNALRKLEEQKNEKK